MAVMVLINPVTIGLLGAATVATAAWIQSGGPQAVASDVGNLWNKMTSADEEAEKTLAPADADKACSDCQEPPECGKLRDELNKIKETLRERHEAMRVDSGPLLKAPRFVEAGPGGMGSWQGHKIQYRQEQKRLKKKLDEYKSRGCKPIDPKITEWLQRDAPTQPRPK